MATNKPQLGATTEYPTHYDPQLLVSIPREEARAKLTSPVAMYGLDLWTAYEVSWLDPVGKPCVAIAEVEVSSDSAAIVESKSLKLYLNSLNQAFFSGISDVASVIRKDLSAAFGGAVELRLYSLADYGSKGLQGFSGVCLDDLDTRCAYYRPESSLLRVDNDLEQVNEVLFSHLLKSNCPVTGQPDWASLQIAYRGQPINREGLLQYIVSFRDHQDFHENCVERIFCDIIERCQPHELSLYARYTRRGGLDINPFRSTASLRPAFSRMARQ